jgi:hypothetical protein
MGNRLDIEGYLSELIGERKIESGDMKFLSELLVGAESVTSLHRSINIKYEWKLASEDGSDTSQGIDAAKDTVYYITKGPLSKPAVRKRIRKLAKYGLIKEVDKKSLSDKALFDANVRRTTSRQIGPSISQKALFDANVRRAKLFRVTEYGLFCVLSQEGIYPSGLLPRYWQSKVMKVLLSSYFEKKTVVRLTPPMYFMIVRFLHERCSITTERLSEIEQAKKENDEAECQEQITRLEDDLVSHAKSFALRLLVDSAASYKDKRERSRHILSFLAHDKKFLKLLDTAVREILSYYKGGELLRRL